MATVHELAVAASINLENALAGFDPADNLELVVVTLDEIAERTA